MSDPDLQAIDRYVNTWPRDEFKREEANHALARVASRLERAESGLEGLREAVLMTLTDDEFPGLRELARDAENVYVPAALSFPESPGETRGSDA